MKWIKPTTKLPIRTGRYFVYDVTGKKRTCLFYSHTKTFTTAVDKWLDEEHQIPIWKPNLFQRFLYFLRLVKDPRYDGRQVDKYFHDEIGKWM